jgi:hypothetical protein
MPNSRIEFEDVKTAPPLFDEPPARPLHEYVAASIEIMRVVVTNWKHLLTVTLIVVVLASILVFLLPVRYEATVFLMPPRHIAEVSSSLVKGLIGPAGWQESIKRYVPSPVYKYLVSECNYAND